MPRVSETGDWRHRDRAQSDETSDTGVTCGERHLLSILSNKDKWGQSVRQQVNNAYNVKHFFVPPKY